MTDLMPIQQTLSSQPHADYHHLQVYSSLMIAEEDKEINKQL